MSNSVEQTDEQAPLLSGTNPPNYSPAEQFEFTALAPRGLSFASVQNRSENVIKGLTFHALNVLEESAKKVMDQPITTKVELSEIVENTGMKISALKEKLTNLKTKFSDKTLIDQAILAMDGINENGVFHSIYKSEHSPQSMSEREFVYVIFVKINSLDCKYILAAQHFKKERNKVQIGFGALTTTVGIGALYTMSLPLTMPFVVSAGVVGGLLTVGGLAMTVSGANNNLDPCTSDHIENWLTLKLVKKNSIKMDQNNQCYIANF